MGEPAFHCMTRHGEGFRAASEKGLVVLSKLGHGSSLIEAQAPSVKFVLKGEETYIIEGRTRRLGGGDFLLVEAGQKVSVRTGPAGAVGLCVYFPCAGAALRDEESPGEGVIAGCAVDPLAQVLRQYASALVDDPIRGSSLAGRIVRQVAGESESFLAGFRHRAERLGSLKRSTRIETLQRVEKARSFIHDNAGRVLTLDEIADQSALSRFHLTRSFTEVFGAPPLAYHRALRLVVAAERLRRGQQSATVIAGELGYSSLSAFSRAFRREFGIPPSEVAAIR